MFSSVIGEASVSVDPILAFPGVVLERYEVPYVLCSLHCPRRWFPISVQGQGTVGKVLLHALFLESASSSHAVVPGKPQEPPVASSSSGGDWLSSLVDSVWSAIPIEIEDISKQSAVRADPAPPTPALQEPMSSDREPAAEMEATDPPVSVATLSSDHSALVSPRHIHGTEPEAAPIAAAAVVADKGSSVSQRMCHVGTLHATIVSASKVRSLRRDTPEIMRA